MMDSYMHWRMRVYEDNIAQTDTLLNKVFNFVHILKRHSQPIIKLVSYEGSSTIVDYTFYLSLTTSID